MADTKDNGSISHTNLQNGGAMFGLTIIDISLQLSGPRIFSVDSVPTNYNISDSWPMVIQLPADYSVGDFIVSERIAYYRERRFTVISDHPLDFKYSNVIIMDDIVLGQQMHPGKIIPMSFDEAKGPVVHSGFIVNDFPLTTGIREIPTHPGWDYEVYGVWNPVPKTYNGYEVSAMTVGIGFREFPSPTDEEQIVRGRLYHRGGNIRSSFICGTMDRRYDGIIVDPYDNWNPLPREYSGVVYAEYEVSDRLEVLTFYLEIANSVFYLNKMDYTSEFIRGKRRTDGRIEDRFDGNLSNRRLLYGLIDDRYDNWNKVPTSYSGVERDGYEVTTPVTVQAFHMEFRRSEFHVNLEYHNREYVISSLPRAPLTFGYVDPFNIELGDKANNFGNVDLIINVELGGKAANSGYIEDATTKLITYVSSRLLPIDTWTREPTTRNFSYKGFIDGNIIEEYQAYPSSRRLPVSHNYK